MVSRPAVLCILDGWGDRTEDSDNAINLAETPVIDRLRLEGPNAQLDASEGFVGLPSGQMGNSEVGHTNIGAGRVVYQDLPKIDAAIADNSLIQIPAFMDFVEKVKATEGSVHLIGLMSPGGVHSHQDHIAALANALNGAGLGVKIHAITDGRDTPPKSALEFVSDFQTVAPQATVATITGRFYAMDRDQRWDRVSSAFDVMVEAKGDSASTALDALKSAYERDLSDEFVLPTAIGDYNGMKPGDAVMMVNFRADRARELLHALIDPSFDGFDRETTPAFSAVLGMVSYSNALSEMMDVLFPPEKLEDVMGAVVSKRGLRQLRIAETEKYAHVTFFFNGGQEEVFDGEDRILVPSPKVATYDLQPEMSAGEVTDKLVGAIEADTYDFIVVNYANTDMVGHTGDLSAAIKAVETVDTCLERLEAAVLGKGGALLITADHGNAEMMKDSATGQPHTAHTMNKVPLILTGPSDVSDLQSGRLADLAPTLLDLMGIAKPDAMTGNSLVVRELENRQDAAE